MRWRACSMPARTSSTTTWRPCRGCIARVRPQADYRQSLDVLAFARRHAAGRADEVRLHGGAGRDGRRSARAAARSARGRDATWPPSGSICSPRAAICRWRSTSSRAQFDEYRDYGLSLGFKMVFSGPLVRSSYMADLVSEEAQRAARAELAAGAGLRGAADPRLSPILARLAGAGRADAAADRASRASRAWRAGSCSAGAPASSTGSASVTGSSSCSRFTAAWASCGLGRLSAVLPGQRRCTWGCSRCSPAC